MTAGLRFVVCLQEASWNQAQRIQQAVFPPSAPTFWERILQVYNNLTHDNRNPKPVLYQSYSTRNQVADRSV